ncbi:MAG: alpha/beta hydrolase [Parafilimonas sp.]|nr:alpha/beta hydrolase [Parafilimonas sp.]
MKTFLAFILSANTICFFNSTAAQPANRKINVGESFTIHSNILNEDRTVLVYLPEGYSESNESYPVLYLTDGETHLIHTGGDVSFLSSPGIDYMPKLIIVGITNTNRARDLTPAPLHGTDSQFPDGGGADKFLSFIISELKPAVNSNYRTSPFEILAGTSLGGLFTINTFINNPKAFNAFFAISPALWWDKKEVVTKADLLLQKPITKNEFLYFTLCSGDSKELQESTQQFQAILKKRNQDSLRWQTKFIDDETHNSSPLLGYYAACKFLYAKWHLDSVNNLTDLEHHYISLSNQYGYKINIPENEINGLGYQLLFSGKADDAIFVFKKNVDNFPADPNVYDSMGDAYKIAGKLDLAKMNYEKGCELGKKQNSTNASSYCNNLNEVRKLINNKSQSAIKKF